MKRNKKRKSRNRRREPFGLAKDEPSGSQEENGLKWEKLSPNEFETLQEYIQCKSN